jgi:hypothetical protein
MNAVGFPPLGGLANHMSPESGRFHRLLISLFKQCSKRPPGYYLFACAAGPVAILSLAILCNSYVAACCLQREGELSTEVQIEVHHSPPQVFTRCTLLPPATSPFLTLIRWHLRKTLQQLLSCFQCTY